MSKIYIAYGSNINLTQMAHRCPTARRIGTGVILDHELTFKGIQGNGYADITPCEGGCVPALAWHIEDADEAALDRYEGFPTHYTKQNVRFMSGDICMDGMAYVMCGGQEIAFPSERYFGIIVDGYYDNGMDVSYFLTAASKTADLCKIANRL